MLVDHGEVLRLGKNSLYPDVRHGVYIFLHILILSSLSYNRISNFLKTVVKHWVYFLITE
jgi:hypothetical protein